MNIPLHTSSPISKWILPLAAAASKIPSESLSLPCFLLEAGFYASLSLTTSNERLNKVRHFCISHFHNIQSFFLVANAGFLVIQVKKIVEILSSNTSLTSMSSPKKIGYYFIIAIISSTVISLLVGTLLPKFQKPLTTRNEGGMFVSNSQHSIIKYSRVVHLVNLIANGGLLFLERNYFWLVIKSIPLLFSNFKAAKLTYSNYSMKFDYNPPRVGENFQYNAANINYSLLHIPNTTSIDQTCTICLEPSPNVSFCGVHKFHDQDGCLSTYIKDKIEKIASTWKAIRTKTHSSKDGTTYDYCIEVPKTSMPSCPECRALPQKNQLQVRLFDVERHSEFGTFIEINDLEETSKQPLFEKIFAIYNVIQAGLSYLLKFSELASLVFRMQKVMMITDLISLGFLQCYLFKNLRKEKGIKHDLKALVTMIAIPIISFLIYSKITGLFEPKLPLQNIFTSLPSLSVFDSKTMSMSWNRPTSQEFMQFFFVYRLLSTLALTLFSKKRIFNLISLSAQSFSLFRVASLVWITLKQQLKLPLVHVAQWGGHLDSTIKEESLTHLTTKFHFMTYSECTSNETHLKWTVDAIYSYVRDFYQGCSWKRQLEVDHDRSDGTSEERMHYQVSIVNRVFRACACTLVPCLEEVAAIVLDPLHGRTSVELFY